MLLYKGFEFVDFGEAKLSFSSLPDRLSLEMVVNQSYQNS